MGLMRCIDRFKHVLKDTQSPSCFLYALHYIVAVLRITNYNLEHIGGLRRRYLDCCSFMFPLSSREVTDYFLARSVPC